MAGPCRVVQVAAMSASEVDSKRTLQRHLSRGDTVFIDVRQEAEVVMPPHLPRAFVNVPVSMTENPSVVLLASATKDLPSEKATPIVVFCAKGGRAERAKGALEEMGYSNVLNGGGLSEVIDAATWHDSLATRRKELKAAFLEKLVRQGGDTKEPSIVALFPDLQEVNPSRDEVCNLQMNLLAGKWKLISKADFPDCKGADNFGDPLYTLGRMSFGMFAPSDLLCSIQSISNTITETPAGADGNGERQHGYDVDVAFTIVGEGDSQGLQGILTTRGNIAPSGNVNRFDVIFAEGIAFPKNPSNELDASGWRSVFSPKKMGGKPLERSLRERFNLFLARLFMGAVPSRGIEMDNAAVSKESVAPSSRGRSLGLRFHLNRPKPGFLDVIYLDEDLRIIRGNRGSVTVARKE